MAVEDEKHIYSNHFLGRNKITNCPSTAGRFNERPGVRV